MKIVLGITFFVVMYLVLTRVERWFTKWEKELSKNNKKNFM